MAGHVTQLEIGAILDPSPWFDGPWESIERMALESDASRRLAQRSQETAVYVISGAGHMERDDHRVALRTGSAITLLKDSDVTIHASETMDILLVTLRTSNADRRS